MSGQKTRKRASLPQGNLTAAVYLLGHFTLSFAGVLKMYEQRKFSFFKEKQIASTMIMASENGHSIYNMTGDAEGKRKGTQFGFELSVIHIVELKG